MKLKSIYAYTEVKNISSIKLLEKCDFKESGSILEKGYYSTREYNMLIYKIERK